MYSDPAIVYGNRAYVKVYIDGERYRFYNGHQLGIKCNPNRCKTASEKKRALNHLRFALKLKLEKGWKPGDEPAIKEEKRPSSADFIRHILLEAEKEKVSFLYLSDLQKVAKGFLNYLKEQDLEDIRLDQIRFRHIKAFLKLYKNSGT